MTTVISTIEYAGTLINDQVTTSPWKSVVTIYPERGSLPKKPQFQLDVLQPQFLDSTRYRVGGAHYPVFTMLTVTPAVYFYYAKTMAREIEMCKGDYIIVKEGTVSTLCMVIDVVAQASAKRVIGASASEFAPGGEGIIVGPASGADALASVDAKWTLQVIQP